MTGDLRILGIDPSLARTGWAVIDQAGNLVQAGGVTSKPTQGESGDRINAIAWEIAMLVPAYDPTHFFCEDQSLSPLFGPGGVKRQMSNPLTAMTLYGLARAIGFGLWVQSRRQISTAYLKTASWRARIGCPGKDRGKDGGLRVVRAHLQQRGIPFSHYSEDELEAVGVALGGLATVHGWKPRRSK